MTKYRIKRICGDDGFFVSETIHNGDIIELEPITEPTEPKCECGQCDEQMFLDDSLSESIHGEPTEPKMEYECDNCGYQHYPMKQKEQSLPNIIEINGVIYEKQI